MTTTAMGQEGFRWFFGIVEDQSDPLKLGRVKVRIINEHDTNVKTDDLTWSHVMLPTTSASLHGVGDTPNLAVGSRVIGYYLDSNEKQLSMIIGTMPIIPDMDHTLHSISGLAREQQNIHKDPIGPEPKPAYAAQYPYNRVITTRSGHVIELDDTPENERVHIYHKSGSYVEIRPDGGVVVKSIKDQYNVTGGNAEIYVKGNSNIQVDGTATMHSKDTTTISSDKGITMDAPGGVTVASGSLTVEKSIASAAGATGTFTSATGEKVNVQNGIITSIG